jgi:spore coat protein U-like protein
MNLLKSSLLAVALLATAPMAMAGTATANMTVTLTLNNSCTVAANPLNFNTQTTLAANIDAQTTVAVTCVSAGPYTVSLSAGGGSAATFASRKMTGPAANTINYSLYTDSARTTANVIGDGTTGNVTLAGNTSGTTTFDVYGRVFGSQNPKPAGVYTDTVTATVSF